MDSVSPSLFRFNFTMSAVAASAAGKRFCTLLPQSISLGESIHTDYVVWIASHPGVASVWKRFCRRQLSTINECGRCVHINLGPGYQPVWHHKWKPTTALTICTLYGATAPKAYCANRCGKNKLFNHWFYIWWGWVHANIFMWRRQIWTNFVSFIEQCSTFYQKDYQNNMQFSPSHPSYVQNVPSKERKSDRQLLRYITIIWSSRV